MEEGCFVGDGAGVGDGVVTVQLPKPIKQPASQYSVVVPHHPYLLQHSPVSQVAFALAGPHC